LVDIEQHILQSTIASGIEVKRHRWTVQRRRRSDAASLAPERCSKLLH
jgi:hypothetical protein